MPTRRLSVRETEIKLGVGDLPGLIRKLRALGASCRGRVFERNVLYDTPTADFRRTGRLLRIRIETPAPSRQVPGGQRRVWLTSKSPVPASRARRYKVKLERETVVRSATALGASLRSLGFRPGFRYDKFRTCFRLPGVHLDLDETPIGVYLEIEGQPATIDHVARALGFSPRDYIRSTYWELYAADCRRRGRIPRNMLFPA